MIEVSAYGETICRETDPRNTASCALAFTRIMLRLKAKFTTKRIGQFGPLLFALFILICSFHCSSSGNKKPCTRSQQIDKAVGFTLFWKKYCFEEP